MKYLILASVVIASISAFTLFWRHYSDVLDQLSEAEAKIEAHEEAARIHQEYLARLREETANWEKIATELGTMDGKDAPLSDHLSRAADRVWP